MVRPIYRIAVAGLAFLGAGSPAVADSCRDNLLSDRPGMIDMGLAYQAETLSSREALSLVGRSSGISFRRNVEDFWRIKVSRKTSPADLDVRYRVEGGGDRSGEAVNTDRDTQRFPVRLLPIQPRILCEDHSYRIISGGFTMLARASGIGLAGLYSLEIDVDVQER